MHFHARGPREVLDRPPPFARLTLLLGAAAAGLSWRVAYALLLVIDAEALRKSLSPASSLSAAPTVPAELDDRANVDAKC